MERKKKNGCRCTVGQGWLQAERPERMLKEAPFEDLVTTFHYTVAQQNCSVLEGLRQFYTNYYSFTCPKAEHTSCIQTHHKALGTSEEAALMILKVTCLLVT